MKVIVLGGGVIGVSTAYYLARAGAEVGTRCTPMKIRRPRMRTVMNGSRVRSREA